MVASRLGLKVNPPVFIGSALLILGFVTLGTLYPEPAKDFFGRLQHEVVASLGWFYLIAVAGFLGFVIWLAASRYGSLKLGKDNERPEFGAPSWFAMLFSAGMGIGLPFYSVAEPVLHFSSPPRLAGGTQQAARWAMETAFFHWGLHAWGIYALMGLGLAYATFRRGEPLTLRSLFRPLFGRHMAGWLGHTTDILAIVGTMFGIATSLGLGVMQVNAGLERLGVLDSTLTHQLWLVAIITVMATASVVSGLKRGIRRLSELNLVLGLLLLLFVLVAGPTEFLMRAFSENLGDYLQHFVARSFDTLAYQGPSALEWQGSWTLFYWGWWIAWAPFVGVFIARISRGRTVREFLVGVLAAPTLLGFIWLAVFGNSALHLELYGGGGMVDAVQSSIPGALYELLEHLPWATLTSGLATVVVVTYFVTSSDSGSLVIDILSADGSPDPPLPQRIFWALTEGAVAAVLLLTGGAGGLQALQTASITTALPLTVLMILLCFSLHKALRQDAPARKL